MSAREEGLPLIMVEAIMADCAALRTGNGGAMDIATGDDPPFMMKEKHVALAEKLAPLMSDPAKITVMGSQAQAAALTEFAWDRMMKPWEVTYALCHLGGS